MYTYNATVIRWLDGDSVEVVIDLGLRISITTVLRLAGIDTPEMHSPILEERQKASQARIRAGELCPVGSTNIVETLKPDSRDKYGRWLGDIRFRDGNSLVSLASTLIAEGLGKAYDGGKK